MGSAEPLWKMDEKLKSENMQKGGGGGDKFSSPQVAREH